MKVGEVTVDVWCDVVLCGGVVGAVSTFLHLLGLSCCTSSLLFLSLWALTSAVCILLPSLKVSPAGKTVLITGCDTGFGFALALHLDKLGFRVVAGCLDVESDGAKKLKGSASSRLTVLNLDVTSHTQLTTTAKALKDIIPTGEVLWGLVNNAGVSTFGEVEWVSDNIFRKLLEVNTLGTIAATKAFLPFIRRAQGRVVNISSMYGRMSNTMRSPYVTSKFAVEGFTDCLRQDMRAWGVKVSLLEPGNFVAATYINTVENVKKAGEAMWAEMDEDLKQDFPRHYFDSKVNQMVSFAKCGNSDVGPVIDAMTAALMEKYPRSRYLPMDGLTRIRVAVATLLPSWVYDWVYASTHR
ncbi:hypothetical protein Pcinc_023133 [Petrolisthes cinctipes]|uniref:D-beta-hydroxybutyrate dehydrogenase, mitochondrial-like n=1 Tax=Petrolisthes cinctipes TaxID=88211 RepID=A0AAE1FCD5_PETCI|nr:hypothetical protein Pcinc_023133 [Petrolisthes cinctipes]